MSEGAIDRSRPAVEILELRHELLRATDRAVGAEAQLDHLRRRAAELTAEADRANALVGELTAERDRLRRTVDAMRGSTTWRLGGLVVRPAARLRGRRSGR